MKLSGFFGSHIREAIAILKGNSMPTDLDKVEEKWERHARLQDESLRIQNERDQAWKEQLDNQNKTFEQFQQRQEETLELYRILVGYAARQTVAFERIASALERSK